MIVLGIDPGFHISGYAIIKKENKKIILLEQGFLKMKPKDHLSIRISIFYDFFVEKLKYWNVSDVSLETPFFYKNPQNFLKLGYLRGILYLIAKKHNLKLHEFAPRQVKISLTGFGGASKEQVSNVVTKLFPNMEKPQKYDVTDAIAITLCAAWQIHF